MALAVGYVLFLFYKGRESTGRSRRDRGGPTNGMKDQGKTGWRSASPSNFACRAKRLRRLLAQRRAPCETATRANRQRSRHRIWSRSPIDRKSTRLNSVTNAHLVCRLRLEKTKKNKMN